jgi:pimeloyl-ACP methyl ester carboxylesterase
LTTPALEHAPAQAALDYLTDLEARSQPRRTTHAHGTIAWRIWGQGEPLVLLHGGAGSWRHWARNIGTFAREYRVIAADTPGMGDSDLPPADADRPGIAALLAQGLDQLLEPQESMHLMGFSMGGGLAGYLTARIAARMKSLTLIGAAGLDEAPRDPPTRKVRHLTGAERWQAHRENLANLMLADPSKVDDLALEIQDQNTRKARAQRLPGRNLSILPYLKDFHGQLSALWGERDAFSMGRIDSRADFIRSAYPRVDAFIVPSAGHWAMYEAPRAVEDYVISRLRALPR